jgi:WD40 repeat protein
MLAIHLFIAMGLLTTGHEAHARGSATTRIPISGLVPNVDDLEGIAEVMPGNAVLRLGATRYRVPGEIQALAFSPNGKMLAVGGREAYVQLLDVASGRRLHRLDAPSWYVRTVAFSPDSTRVAGWGISRPSLGAVWDTRTGKQLAASRDRPLAVRMELLFTADGKNLLINSKTLQVRDADTCAVVRETPDKPLHFGVSAVALAPDGRTVALGGCNPAVLFLDLPTDKVLSRIEGDRSYGADAVAFNGDGKVLATGSYKGITLYDVETGKARVSLEGRLSNFTAYVAFAEVAKRLVSLDADERVMLWDWQAAKPTARCLVEGVHVAAVSKDGRLLATAGEGANTVRLWDLVTGKERIVRGSGHSSPDGRQVATGDRQQTCLWSLPTGKLERSWPVRAERLLFSADGRQLATGPDGENNLLLIDLRTGKQLELPAAPPLENWPRPMGFLSGGREYLTARSAYLPGTHGIKRWDAVTGKLLAETTLHGDAWPHLLCPDGRTIICTKGSDRAQIPAPGKGDPTTDMKVQQSIRGRSQILTAYTGAFIRELQGAAEDPHERAMSVHAASAGLAIAPRKDGTVGVWELASGRLISRLPSQAPQATHAPSGVPLPPEVAHAALSPDGRLAATTMDGGGTTPNKPSPVRLWDVATGREIFKLKEAGTYVASLAFSPDGAHLASGLDDGTTLLWDLAPAWKVVRRKSAPLSADELEALWKTLGEPDPSPAYQAVDKLAAAPAQAVAMLRQQLLPVPHDRQQGVEALIKLLDSPDAAQRTTASQQLMGAREVFEEVLWQAMHTPLSLEARQRLTAILARPFPEPRPDVMRQLRAIQLVEWTGSDEAQKLLSEIGKGAAGASQTIAARDALARLQRDTVSVRKKGV